MDVIAAAQALDRSGQNGGGGGRKRKKTRTFVPPKDEITTYSIIASSSWALPAVCRDLPLGAWPAGPDRFACLYCGYAR